MIKVALNGMLAILLANWLSNELPHAAGILGNPVHPTKDDLGLGPLYHGTTAPRAKGILVKGLELSEDGIVWLAYSYTDALDRARELSPEVSEPPAVLTVNLPGEWPLERAETGVYLSHRLVPARYIKLSGSGNPTTATGTCYEDAWRYVIREEEGFLVHGSVQLSAEGPRINHAWVELPTGWIWEPQTGGYYTIEDFKAMSPTEEHRYTGTEAAIMAARSNKHGPWSSEERSMWL